MSVGSSGYDQRMMREARMGLMIIIALFVTLIYFGYQYLRSRGNHIPDSVWQAPLAVEIDPDDVLQMTRRRMGRDLSPDRELPGVRGERFADQRSEFQPTQPLPQNLLSGHRDDGAGRPSDSSEREMTTDARSSPATSDQSPQSTIPRSNEFAKASNHSESERPASDSSLFQPGLRLPKQVPAISKDDAESFSRTESDSGSSSSVVSKPLGLTVLPPGGSGRLPSAKEFQPLPNSGNAFETAETPVANDRLADTKSQAEPANLEQQNTAGSRPSWQTPPAHQGGLSAEPSVSSSGEFTQKRNASPAGQVAPEKSANPNRQTTDGMPRAEDVVKDSLSTSSQEFQSNPVQRDSDANKFEPNVQPQPRTTPSTWPERQTPSTTPPTSSATVRLTEKKLATLPANPQDRLTAPANGRQPRARQPSNSSAVDEWPRKYELKSHESMWDAAQHVYGDGQWFRALYQHNLSRLENAVDRQQSVSLECPAPLELANRFPELAPPDFAERDPSRSIDNTKYTTLAGDSLFEIARQQLGQASRYLELLELNRSQLPPGVNHLTRLPAGIELNLPH